MPHKLVKLSGPALTFGPAGMSHVGATLKLKFTDAGVYHFTTKPGEDYPAMASLKTVGERSGPGSDRSARARACRGSSRRPRLDFALLGQAAVQSRRPGGRSDRSTASGRLHA